MQTSQIVKADPGFSVLEIVYNPSCGLRIGGSKAEVQRTPAEVYLRAPLPVVAWEIEPGDRPRPIAPGLMFQDYPIVIDGDPEEHVPMCALRYPDGSIEYFGGVYEDEDRFLVR
jgi:hypothetical protein